MTVSGHERVSPGPSAGSRWPPRDKALRERNNACDRYPRRRCFALSGLGVWGHGGPGRRYAAGAASLCTGLVCGGPFGARIRPEGRHSPETATIAPKGRQHASPGPSAAPPWVAWPPRGQSPERAKQRARLRRSQKCAQENKILRHNSVGWALPTTSDRAG